MYRNSHVTVAAALIASMLSCSSNNMVRRTIIYANDQKAERESRLLFSVNRHTEMKKVGRMGQKDIVCLI
jgi:hypothetical protein